MRRLTRPPAPAQAPRPSRWCAFAACRRPTTACTSSCAQLDLDIRRGEFLTLLGPSGSGKTTTLMMLAGFESPTAGEILLDGRPITRTPPHKRNFGMVFQNYALFPHLTVGQNVAYPLTVRKVAEGRAGAARRARARHGAAGGHGRALPGAALGRPAAARRAGARAGVRAAAGADGRAARRARQAAARAHADRAEGAAPAARRHLRLRHARPGRGADDVATASPSSTTASIQQIDAVDRMYEAPANRFVAGFIGDSTMLRGTVARDVDGERCGDRAAPTAACLAGVNVNGARSGAAGRCVHPARAHRRCIAQAPAERGNVLQAQVRGVDLLRRPPAPAVRRRRRPGRAPPSSCRCPARRRRRSPATPSGSNSRRELTRIYR